MPQSCNPALLCTAFVLRALNFVLWSSMSRQTQSFLIERMKEAGVRPQGQHGQNFLIDLNLLDLLVRAADVTRRDVVLEVGTGMGSLTARLAERAAAVVTVEIDERMQSLAAEELGGAKNVRMLLQDA